MHCLLSVNLNVEGGGHPVVHWLTLAVCVFINNTGFYENMGCCKWQHMMPIFERVRVIPLRHLV